MKNKLKRVILIDLDDLFKEKITKTLATFDEIIDFHYLREKKETLNLTKLIEKRSSIVLIGMNFNKNEKFIKKIKENYIEVKTIAVFEKSEDALNRKISLFDTDSYLTKSDSIAEIKDTLEKVFYNGFYYKETYIKQIKEAHDKILKNNTNEQNSIFTKRELQVLELICQQKTTQEISKELFLSPRTIEGHRNSMMLKTGTKNVAGLIVFSFQNEILEKINS